MLLSRDINLRLHPLRDLQESATTSGLWTVTGHDPQFLLTRTLGKSIDRGKYWIIAKPGLCPKALVGSAVYVDTGAGFNEGQKLAICFEMLPDGQAKAPVNLEQGALQLRFDPCDTGLPSFNLRKLTLARRNTVGAQAASDMQPRVLLNLVRLVPEGSGAGGAGRLATAFLTHLPNSVQLRVAISPAWQQLILRFPDIDFIVVPSDDNVHMASSLDWCQCYVDPLNGLRPITIAPRVAVISIVLDLQHMRMPWLFSEAEIKQRVLEYSYAIARSDRLVAISSYEAGNLVEFYGVDRISTAHLAGFMAEDSGLQPSEIRQRRTAAQQESSYLIYPAVPWLHKNHEILIQAVGILKRRGVDIRLVLTNTGGRPGGKEHLEKVAKTLRVDDLISLKAFISEQELFDLFIRCRGMLFPSLYEGFGIPLVDAMALGVPVLTNNTSAVFEICGDAAAYFSNVSNAIVVADEIEAFWNDAEGRRELEEAGLNRAQRFSSAKMVAELRRAIDAAVATKQGNGPLLPAQSLFVPPRFGVLSVFVSYGSLDEVARGVLADVRDINLFHASMFGAEADVTVGLDVPLVDDPGLRTLFRSAPKLICFDGSHQANIEAAIRDFSMRFDHAEFQLVTSFRSASFRKYSADALTTAVMALRLHDSADYAVFDDRLTDCVLDGIPDEREGVLAYDHRRRSGLAVTDTLIRRASARDQKNGTVAFLSQFCSTYRRLRIPEARH